MAKIAHKWTHRNSVGHGMNDSEYPAEIATTQVTLSKNFDMMPDGRLESRGGSQKTSASATAASETIHLEYEYRSVAAGVITRHHMVFAGTRLLKYDPSAKTYSEIDTGLEGIKPGVATFRDDSGVDAMYYCDGKVFKFYDGTGVTNVLTNFQAGAATGIPKHLVVKHERLWASGGTNEHIRVFYSPVAYAEQNWGANDYVTIGGGDEAITGLSEVSDFPLVTTEDGIYIIRGRAGSSADPYVVIKVYEDEGCSSHHSIVPQGGDVYWGNVNGAFIGKLRAAVEDGLDVQKISGPMQNAWDNIKAGQHSNIHGVYFPPKQQIYWVVESAAATADPDTLLVYSISRSNPDLDGPTHGADIRFVWSGKWDYAVAITSIGMVRDSNAIPNLYLGSTDGFSREMYTDYLDNRASDGTGGTSVSYEVRPREESWGGPGGRARVYAIHPSFHQRKNTTWQVEWILNQSQRLPSSAQTITFRGNVPYLHLTDETLTSTLGSTVMRDKPNLTHPIRIGWKGFAFQPIFTNVGGDVDGEAFAFVGISYEIQPK
jgi:hypothetical protein